MSALSGAFATPGPLGAEAFKLAYEEPFWSGVDPGCTWALEVVRAGVELEPIALSAKACYLVGRIPVCDIVLENDTVSRQHAVFQSRSNGKLYLYDLGSTHGTFVNGKRLEPKTYVELTPGVQIKFGMTARNHILSGEGKEPSAEPAVAVAATVAVAEAPKLSKRRQKGEEFFLGSVEDAEKFVKQKEHEKRQKERNTQQKKQKEKEKKRGEGRDEFDDEDEEEADKHKKKNAASDGNDSDDSDAPQNAGEADPDKMVVGAARSNWDEYEMDDENDEFYDRASKKRAISGEATSGKALSRDDILNAKVELDLQIRDLDAKIVAGKKSSASGAAGEEEDELDAYMKVVADVTVSESVERMTQARSDLEVRRRRLDKMLAATTTALDRLKQRDEPQKKDTLESRVAAVLNAGFAAPMPVASPAKKPTATPAPAPAVVAPAPAVADSGKGKQQNSTVAALAEFVRRESKKAKVDPKPAAAPIVARDPDYEDVEWAPPKNQAGDGSTDLNKRFGY
jgi:pSer/pThr/pTyr-binding forkhead associated (FHA) protein